MEGFITMRKPLIFDKRIKKGGFEDVFFVLVIIFTIVIFILILAKVWGDVKNPLNEGLIGVMPSDTSVNITETLDDVTSTTNMFDKLLPFLLIGLFGFVMVGASMYTQHPILIFIGIIIIAVAVLLGAIYSNIYHQIAETDEFASTTDDFSISDKYMNYLPFIIFLIAIGIGAMVMYLKKQGGTSGL